MSKSKRRRLGLPLLVLLALSAGLFFGYRHFWQRPPAVTYQTVPLARGKVTARVTASGTLSPLVTVEVGSQVSGRIAELFVDFNSPVKEGQILAKIDPQLFQAAVEQARANHSAAQGSLAKARANETNAKKNLERMRELAARELIAEADLDIAEAQAISASADVQAARGSVEQTRASLKLAEVNLGYTTIISPVDGVVISRSVDVGQTVAASLQAPTLFEIAEDLARMQVNTSVAEADVGKLSAGMKAMFRVDAYPQEQFQGSVRQIRNAPKTEQNVVTYDAVIDVDNPDLLLKPGMTANVTFIHAEREDVLLIPNAALRFRPSPEVMMAANIEIPEGQAQRGRGSRGRGPSDQREVWVLRGDSLERAPIRTGITDGSFTEVVEGSLEEGDELVTEADTPSGGQSDPSSGNRSMRRIL